MTWSKKYFWEIMMMGILFIIGLVLRFQGISTNHSFWADEAYVSSFSRDIAAEKTSFMNGVNTIGYQRLQTITTTGSFKLFGISEWSARLPSVLWGSLGIIFAYLVAKKNSNKWGGLLAAFLFTFLQLNLAHSTQAKPYAAIQTLFLMSVYFARSNIFVAATIAVLSTLYNYVGVVAFIPVILQIVSVIRLDRLKPKFWIIGIIGVVLLAWMLNVGTMVGILLHPNYNWTTYLRELFWRQFGFITLPAILGLFLIKDKKTFWGILLSILGLLGAWNFIMYSRNLRYLMPVFGILIVLFGVFWGKVGEIVYKRPALICIAVMVMIFAGGYKVVRKPAVYYTPNADFFADVQNADYKTFFKHTYEKFPDLDSYPVFSNLVDSFAWYAHKKPAALFKVGNLPPYLETQSGIMVYPDLTYFLSEMKKYPKGFVMVEDWQSILPEDIKEYVKKNLKFELRVESMEVSPADKWPLELYSWGFDEKRN